MDITLRKFKNLGEGSYGKVYQYNTDDDKQQYAVKVFSAHNANLLEVSILATFRHPYLSHAEYIDYNNIENKIYVFMPLAKCDLGKKLYNLPFTSSYYKEKIWCYQIAKAILCLHNHNFIHADLKPGNILYFNDDLVKVTDFTLSVKQYNEHDSFKRNACTINYRPPEVFIEGKWDKSLDIWSLGCLFYEIVFRIPLFHHQKDFTTAEDSNPRRKLYQRMFNALLDWRIYTNQLQDESFSKYYDTPYRKLVIHKMWTEHDYLFRDLILKMLRWNAQERINIQDVLQHPWFMTDVKLQTQVPQLFTIRMASNTDISTDNYNRLVTLIQSYAYDDVKKRVDNLISTLALNLAKRCSTLTLDENTIAKLCTIIALKVVYVYNHEKIIQFNALYANYFDEKYYQLEASILKHLGYLLH